MKDTILDQHDFSNGSTKQIYNTAFKWALIGALIQFIMTLANYYMNGQTMVPKDKTISIVVFVIGIIVIIAVIYNSIKEFRNIYSDGYITFKRGFFVAFLCALFLAILSSILTYLLYQFVVDFDTMIAEQLDASIIELKKRKMSVEEMEMALKMSKKFMTMPLMIGWVLIGGLILNTIIGLISAAILKKEPLHE